jgi:hypothetical protein
VREELTVLSASLPALHIVQVLVRKLRANLAGFLSSVISVTYRRANCSRLTSAHLCGFQRPFFCAAQQSLGQGAEVGLDLGWIKDPPIKKTVWPHFQRPIERRQKLHFSQCPFDL